MSTGGQIAGPRRLGDVAVVAIGRNEGERLQRCLQSARADCDWVVYVDSGSSDGSTAMAEAIGAVVVRLDMTLPFTAARARNAGFAEVQARWGGVDLVQFVDGDCELEPNWMRAARSHLIERAAVAAVFGRRRERYPDRSIYNRLCDIEWDVPCGEVSACGGDVMIRRDALAGIGGYKSGMIAGEEPEMCVRLRRNGWKIERLPLPMTIHDAAMTRFGQWWRRTQRSGHAYAEGASLHGKPPDFHCVRETRRNWLWGLVLPFSIIALVLLVSPFAAALLLVYPAQVARLYLKRRRSSNWPLLTSFFNVLGRFPEMAGQAKFVIDRWRGRQSGLIEYK